MLQFDFIGGGHQHHVGQAAEIGDIESACMGRAVSADKSRPVHGETHRKVLQGNVMHDLIVSALQEGGIDSDEGLVAFGRKPCGECHPVLFGNADVTEAAGKFLFEQIKARAGRHSRGNRHNLVIFARRRQQAVGENAGIAGGVGLGFLLGSGQDVEFGDTVHLVGGAFGRQIALALARDGVDKNGPFVNRIAHVFEHRQKMLEIVAVDGAHVIEAQLFEQRAAGNHAARVFFRALRRFLKRRGELLGKLFADFANAEERL